MRIVISGSSGLIGTALCDRLRNDGHDVVRLVRRQPAAGEVRWDPAGGQLDPAALDGASAVINLSGAGIGDKRWTDSYKAELRDSRLQSTELLVRSIAAAATPPPVLLSASAIGYYGNRGDETLDERSAPGDDFLSRLTVDWEAAATEARAGGTVVTLLRTGIVLSTKGGALRKQLPLFKLGLGGKFGSGRQWQSWISLDDEVGAICRLLDGSIDGPVNLTAPEPVTNAEFTKTLAKTVHRPAVLPIPSFAPKLLLGGELVDALLLGGQKVLPTELQRIGYEFASPRLDEALATLLSR